MENGFIKVAAVTPRTKIANIAHNLSELIYCTEKAVENGAKIIVFPELSITGYCCESLFLQYELISKSKEAMAKFKQYTENVDALIFVGAPYCLNHKLYNTMMVFNRGKILGIIPKVYLPNYDEFSELRYFEPAFSEVKEIEIGGETVPFGTNLLFENDRIEGLCVAAEICADLWGVIPPSSLAAQNGAIIIVNGSASNELVGKNLSREQLLTVYSSRIIAGYVYSNPGAGESTENLIFNGHNIIAENGKILQSRQCGFEGIVYSEIDVQHLIKLRRRNNNYVLSEDKAYRRIKFIIAKSYTELTRHFNKYPFISEETAIKEKQCIQLITILTNALICKMREKDNESIEIAGDNFCNLFLTLYLLSYIFKTEGVKKRKVVCKSDILKKYSELNKIAEVLKVELTEKVENIGFRIETTSMTECILGTESLEYTMNTYTFLSDTPQSLIDETVEFIVADREDIKKIVCSTIKRELSDKRKYEVEEFFVYYIIVFGFGVKKVFLLALKVFQEEYTQEMLAQKLFFILKRLCDNKSKPEWITGPKTVELSMNLKYGWIFPKKGGKSLWGEELEWLKNHESKKWYQEDRKEVRD